MRDTIKRRLDSHPRLFSLAQKLYRLAAYGVPRVRVTTLSRRALPRERLREIATDPAYNDVVSDLVAYTGMTAEQLEPYLLRHPQRHFESEFEWVRPRTREELTWFYRCSSAYLFANAAHPFLPVLDRLSAGKVLDYGAGIGCHTIELAKRGLRVDFVEIGRVQADFIRFRAERRGLDNVREVRPYHAGKFDAVECIRERYDAVIAMDVLEHIPDYHRVVRKFIAHLEPGGLIIENSPFDDHAREIAIHVRASMPLAEAMAGMVRIDDGIWQKSTTGQRPPGSEE